MTKRPNRRKSTVKKFFCGLLIAAALVALFLVSFFVTKLVLDANQNPGSYSDGKHAEASATPKPTYEELEKMVIEKNKKIEDLEDELERYRGNAVQATISPLTQVPAQTQTPEPAKTPAPPVQTSAPTASPQTQAPVSAPVATKAPAAENSVPAA
ncbi:MAG: hypothetical protein E7398_05035 [Ruminococcaceae bacterium]|nr:hypothetical protein [Oscillospiraceae bacterium]